VPRPANNADRRRLIGIYLNDHLMGVCSGVELARRLAVAFRHSTHGDLMRELAVEIDEDRASLIGLMRRLNVSPSRPKMAAGWLTETVGRLKPGWRLLRELAADDPALAAHDFDYLINRAERQKQTLDELRRQTAGAVFVQA